MSIPLIYQEETDYLPRSEQIWIEPNDIISQLCHISKNLFNEGNYIIRQQYFKTGIILRYEEVNKRLKSSKNYLKLPVQTAQQTLKVLDSNWQGYSEAIYDWKIHPEKYLGRPGLPGYLDKDGEFVLYFTDQQIKNIDGEISFPKKRVRYRFQEGLDLSFLKIKTRIKSVIKELRIIPKGIGYLVDLVYYKEVKKLSLDKENVIGLDFGVRNVVTMVAVNQLKLITAGNNIGEVPIIIKGGVLKSINQYYNKKREEIQSIYDREILECFLKRDKNGNIRYLTRKTGPAMQRLTENRNKKIKDIMHKYSRWIIDYCIQHNIGTIIIGYNPEWKQEIRLGKDKYTRKKNNQNFATIPHYMLKEMIKYKSEEVGIQAIEQDESHTSKCSFLDDESVEHHDVYMGKRISRGLFRSSIGKIINADVQGAYNIIKKAIPKAFEKLRADGTEDVGLHPVRINPLSVNRNINIIGG